MKSGTTRRAAKGVEAPATPRAGGESGRNRLVAAVAVLAILALSAAAYVGYQQYRVSRLAEMVRRSFAARRYDDARAPLHRWLDARPRSGEARYYRGWLALVDAQPREAVEAVDLARKLGFDAIPLDVLAAIYHARAGRINVAEPILREAFDRKTEPQAEVARELARIYLATYRLTQAAEVVERCRELVPTDPQPYLWSNEIDSRSGATPAILIRNYRAALERDPNLDKARLGLAEQLSKDRRFDEADQEYRTYLRRNSTDAAALVGLGRNAFQDGDIDGATREFEAALKVDPRQRDALKELAQLDMRFGRFDQACRRLELLTQIDPFDHEVRYTYSQALRVVGQREKSRAEGERAAQLRNEHDQLIQLRSKIILDPGDLKSRFAVARWMLTHGHADEGLKWTGEILRVAPGHSATHQALADYYTKLGDSGRANYHRTMASSSQDAR